MQVTYLLLIANLVVFGLETVAADALFREFALWPLGSGFRPWQIVSSAFLHASVPHLALNMFGLWMFGRDVERYVGPQRFLALYTASVVAAATAQLIVTGMSGSIYPTVGASGGLFGVLTAFAMLFPRRTIMLLIPPIPLPAPVFVTMYAVLELIMGVTGTQSGVAHFAHLGGMVGGFWLVRRWRSRRGHWF